MIRKEVEIRKTVYLLEKEDIERAAADFYGKDVKIGDMDFYFNEDVDLKTRKSKFYFGVGIENSMEELLITSDDGNTFEDCLGFDEAADLSGLGTFPDESEIFDFDVAEFGSYLRWTEITSMDDESEQDALW